MKEINVTINLKQGEIQYLAEKEQKLQMLKESEEPRKEKRAAIERKDAWTFGALNGFIKTLKEGPEQKGPDMLKTIGMIKDKTLRIQETEIYTLEMIDSQLGSLDVVQSLPDAVRCSPAYIAFKYNINDFVANSIDAGASLMNIKVACESDNVGPVKITFEDNGSGFPKKFFKEGEVECDARLPFGVGTTIASDKKNQEDKIGGAGLGMRRATQFLTHTKGEVIGGEAFPSFSDKHVGGKLMLSNQGPNGGARLVFESAVNKDLTAFHGFYAKIKRALGGKAKEVGATMENDPSAAVPAMSQVAADLGLLSLSARAGGSRMAGLRMLSLESSSERGFKIQAASHSDEESDDAIEEVAALSTSAKETVGCFEIEELSESEEDEEDKVNKVKGQARLTVPCKSIFTLEKGKVKEIEEGSDKENQGALNNRGPSQAPNAK